jgi:hypothetical protein
MGIDEENLNLEHYYGDTVRAIFLSAGVVFLVTMVRDQEFLSFYLIVGALSVLTLVILAGLTNPLSKKIIKADAVISIIMFLLFEYLAIAGYMKAQSFSDSVFLLRQLLAILFLIALYFSTKTIRGMLPPDTL